MLAVDTELKTGGVGGPLMVEALATMLSVALRVGFSDQSQFSLHFKRIVGATPRQFRISARTR
jgi:AraC-like DNA-binding protein